MALREPRLFLCLYILDQKGNDTCIGQNYFKEEHLVDFESAIPKIKLQIDKDIAERKRWAEEKEQRKKDLKWTGQKFKRGDYVFFKGNDKYKPVYSYVWTHFCHGAIDFYVIEHEDGEDRKRWLAKPPFENQDGFECVHSSQLQEGLKYIQVNCSEEFQFETDKLELADKGLKEIKIK